MQYDISIKEGIKKYIDIYFHGENENDVNEVPRFLTVFLDFVEFNKYVQLYFDRYQNLEYRKSLSTSSTEWNKKVSDINKKCLEWATKVQTLVSKFTTVDKNKSRFKSFFRIGTAEKYNEMVRYASDAPEGKDKVDRACVLMQSFADAILNAEEQRSKSTINDLSSTNMDYNVLVEQLDNLDIPVSDQGSDRVSVGGSRRRKYSRRRYRCGRTLHKRRKSSKVRKMRYSRTTRRLMRKHRK